MSSSETDVCAAVVSDLTYDARVWKEARSLAGAGYSVRLLGCAYEIKAPRSRSEGTVHVTEVPLGSRTGRISFRGRVGTLLRLWLAVLRTDARVYHAHNIHVVPAVFTAAKLRHRRWIYDGHELYGSSPGGGRWRRVANFVERLVERFAVRRADGVITTNGSRVEVLRERHGRADITILANVPTIVAELEPLDPGFPPDVPILLYQGGIYAEGRAFRETIEALKQLPDLHFVIIGFGRDSDLASIRRWAHVAGVHDRVHLLPARPFDELVRTAALATIGLVPVKAVGVNQYLGDTNKLHEYLMAGLPVAASDLPEISRVASEGNPPVGEVFDATSPNSIAAALRRLLDDPNLSERRDEARRLAVDHYNWEVMERRLLTLYRGLLPGS